MGNTNSGRGGLPREKRREIERLIDAGWKNARVARECGVDVSTVSRYKRRIRLARQAAAELGLKLEDAEPTTRCGGCGAMILDSAVQCLACLQRKTIFEPARRARLTKVALRPKRSPKLKVAA